MAASLGLLFRSVIRALEKASPAVSFLRSLIYGSGAVYQRNFLSLFLFFDRTLTSLGNMNSRIRNLDDRVMLSLSNITEIKITRSHP